MKEKIKKRSSVSGGVFVRVFAVVFLVLAICGVLAAYSWIDRSMRETIDIAVLNQDVKAGDVIKEDYVVKYQVVESDFNQAGSVTYTDKEGKVSTVSSYTRWEERDRIIDTYASYFIRKGTPVYQDSYLYTTPDKNPWITDLPDDFEVQYVDVKYMDLGGKNLIPGDRIRLRAVYQIDSSAVISDPNVSEDMKKLAQAYAGVAAQTGSLNSVPKAAMLFDDIRISDMLNSSGESILKLYMEISKYPISQREDLLKDDEFIARLVPVKVGFVVSREDGTRIAEVTNLANAKLVYSVLSRDIEDYVNDFENINNSIVSLDYTSVTQTTGE